MSLYPTPPPTTFGLLSDGVDGIRQTLRVMVRLQRQWKKDPGIVALASSLVKNLPQGDTIAEVRALHAFVRDRIRYTNDTYGVETIRTPKATLDSGVGDCDDKSLLLSALLGAIGRPTRFVAMGFKSTESYSHVLAQVRLGPKGKWYSLETIKNVPAGWEPDGATRLLCAYN